MDQKYHYSYNVKECPFSFYDTNIYSKLSETSDVKYENQNQDLIPFYNGHLKILFKKSKKFTLVLINLSIFIVYFNLCESKSMRCYFKTVKNCT